MNQIELLSQLEGVEAFASASKLSRFLHNPFRYLVSIVYSKLLTKVGDFHYVTNIKTFWGQTMRILLPSAIDIYLSGGKTHNSELRLAKYLIKELKSSSYFLDVGAHFGYFSLLASYILDTGKVYSIEPSSKSFNFLETNTKKVSNMHVFNCALTDKDEQINFFEFPTYYS